MLDSTDGLNGLAVERSNQLPVLRIEYEFRVSHGESISRRLRRWNSESVRPVWYACGVSATIRGVAGVGLVVLLVAGCDTDGREGAGPPTSATQLAAPVPTGGAAATDPMSEAALRETLARQYAFIQARDWGALYDFTSPRCQLRDSRDAFVSAVDSQAKDRDFSGPEEYLITMSGPVATVVIKSYDGKGKMMPGTWTFMNGSWVNDGC